MVACWTLPLGRAVEISIRFATIRYSVIYYGTVWYCMTLYSFVL